MAKKAAAKPRKAAAKKGTLAGAVTAAVAPPGPEVHVPGPGGASPTAELEAELVRLRDRLNEETEKRVAAVAEIDVLLAFKDGAERELARLNEQLEWHRRNKR